MKIVFVPDAGVTSGLGHISRCLALAQAFEVRCGVQSKFLVSDPNSRIWLNEQGMQASSKLDGNADLIIIDSYKLSPLEITKLKARAKTFVAFDDFGMPPDGSCWVINSAIRASALSYGHAASKGLLLGPKFHPLRSEYWEACRQLPKKSKVQNILITLGGGRKSESFN